jgi:hypothetical protein
LSGQSFGFWAPVMVPAALALMVSGERLVVIDMAFFEFPVICNKLELKFYFG